MGCQFRFLCPWCNENRKGRTNHKGHWGYRAPRKPWSPPEWETRAMKKPNSSGPGKTIAVGAGSVLASMPCLVEFLTHTVWDDGTERQPGTVLLFADAGRWKVCLSDRDGERVCFVSGDTVEAMLETLEEGLATDRLDWRAMKGGSRRK